MNLQGVLFALIFAEVQHLPEFYWQHPFPFSELPNDSCVHFSIRWLVLFYSVYKLLVNFRNYVLPFLFFFVCFFLFYHFYDNSLLA